MKKKLIATVMAATMAVTALTGCGSSSASSAKKDIKVPTSSVSASLRLVSAQHSANICFCHISRNSYTEILI